MSVIKMYLLIFCAVCCLPTSLAFVVTFYQNKNITTLSYDSNKPLESCSPHRILYQRGDIFTMHLRLLDNTSVNQAIAVLKILPDSVTIKHYFTSWKILEMRLPAADIITIDVELVTKDGCLRETILEGVEVHPELAASAGYKKKNDNDICLGKNKCVAVVDATRRCKATFTKPCEATSITDNEVRSHPSKFYPTSDAPSYEDLESLVNKKYRCNVALLQLLDSVFYNNQTQKQNGAVIDTKDENPRYFTVMIITSVIAAVASLTLLIISIRHFCWKKDDPPLSRLILPINQNRYYENMIFRDDSQQEIGQQQQRATQPKEPYYEEIDDQLDPSTRTHCQQQGRSRLP